jgi:hypothetical protein
MKKRLAFLIFLSCFLLTKSNAQNFVTDENIAGAFPLVSAAGTANICVDRHDYFIANKAASLLQQDIENVTGKWPKIINQISGKNILIICSIERSSLINELVSNGKLDTNDLSGKWEAYKLQVIDHPFKGVNKALVIVGSDRQGTAYGVFTLSKQMGVSPWYWWADVPAKKKKEVFVKAGTYFYGPPAVKYRGFFINDEAPALSGWVQEKFGGFNHKFYVHVFQLLLRLRANYLWPAMWGSMFDVDDTLNPILANKYGIIMGTAHNEPMMRAHQEWVHFGQGPWNYQTNAAVLDTFWEHGIQRMDHRQSIVTIGMRGNGDKPMTKGTNIALLEKIVKEQRKIIAEVTGNPASETPQDWALYKEVQTYYDEGMRVPDDVTLLYSDDNWGNIRRLPSLKDSLRPGGYGIYYHFDYVGAPRNYKWLNTNQISRVFEQMHLAYEYHARQIWVVNVGDIKPMEFPISFFMDYAWNANTWTVKNLGDYTKHWAAEQFGDKYAEEIANILEKYTQYNSRRKPELLSPDTYSLDHYQEAERVTHDYNAIWKEAEKIYNQLPSSYKPAFFQLVLYPTAACANLNDLYVTVGENRLFAKQGRPMTNALADSAVAMFKEDHLLSHYYNKVMENGRWDHMMDQTHIGYVYWQEPPWNVMPQVVRIQAPDRAEMGVAIQGSDLTLPIPFWFRRKARAVLPVFNPYNNQQKYYMDIFDRGEIPFHYQVKADKKWIQISHPEGEINRQQRIWISIDWKLAPHGKDSSLITITGPDNRPVQVTAIIDNPSLPHSGGGLGAFVESNGYVSMEAPHYTKAVNSGIVHWVTIPGLGRTGSAVTAFPVTASSQTPGGDNPHLEYDLYLFDTGTVKVEAYLSPTLNFANSPNGLRYAVSFDNKPPEIVNMTADDSDSTWAKHVSDNINIQTTLLHIDKPGEHILKFWMVDPGVVLQKIVVDLGGVKQSYLGPPESYFKQ